MTFAKELMGLEEGEIIEGGTFMQALSDEPLLWVCVEPYDDLKRQMVIDVSWLGVDLGRFLKTETGVVRLDDVKFSA